MEIGEGAVKRSLPQSMDSGSRSDFKPIILYFNGTFVHRLNGAHVRVFNLLEFLLTCGYRVILYSYADHGDCPWGVNEIALFHEMFPNVELILDRRPGYFYLWKRAKKMLSGVFPSLTNAFIRARLPGATPNYARLTANEPNAVLIVNYANGLIELNGVTSEITIIETHDLDFLQFSKRFGFSLTSSKIVNKLRSEFSLLGAASALIAIGAPEAGLFRLCFPKKPVFFVPDYTSRRAPIAESEAIRSDYDLVFVGSENAFNVNGLCEFIDEYRDILNTFTLAVAGKVSMTNQVIRVAQGISNVRLLGYVNDISDLYSRSKVAISPVDGTGLKIKVIEALAAGKPVFGSRHTIDGLPLGHKGCIFSLEDLRTTKLLQDQKALAVAGQVAKSYAANLATISETMLLASYLESVGKVASSEAAPQTNEV
jgi:glycosyltransferase involved in cell wall biosynthesis